MKNFLTITFCMLASHLAFAGGDVGNADVNIKPSQCRIFIPEAKVTISTDAGTFKAPLSIEPHYSLIRKLAENNFQLVNDSADANFTLNSVVENYRFAGQFVNMKLEIQKNETPIKYIVSTSTNAFLFPETIARGSLLANLPTCERVLKNDIYSINFAKGKEYLLLNK